MTAETRPATEQRRPNRRRPPACDGMAFDGTAALSIVPSPEIVPPPVSVPSAIVEPAPAEVTAAVATAAELKALGVECLFLMTGRDNTLWIALQEAGIRQILARTEAGAVYMADGYARVTGRPTFVYGAYGPGAANVAGSLAEPFWSSSPVVAMASAMRRTERHRMEYQELDQPK